jgi:hypothetical protein
VNAASGDTIEVGPGRYGDLDGDGVFDDPGDEAAEIDTGCDCLVKVDRSLVIVSRAGAGATIIDAGGAPVRVVLVDSPVVVFGLKGKGFTVTGSADTTGIDAPRENVRVAGNRALRNGGNGFVLDGNAGVIIAEDNPRSARSSGC